MKIRYTLVMTLSLSAGAVLASPQQQSHPTDHSAMGHAHTQHAPKQDAFKALDTNQDGKLSTSELAKHPHAAHAAMVDADKDGKLDRKEFAALQKM